MPIPYRRCLAPSSVGWVLETEYCLNSPTGVLRCRCRAFGIGQGCSLAGAWPRTPGYRGWYDTESYQPLVVAVVYLAEGIWLPLMEPYAGAVHIGKPCGFRWAVLKAAGGSRNRRLGRRPQQWRFLVDEVCYRMIAGIWWPSLEGIRGKRRWLGQ